VSIARQEFGLEVQWAYSLLLVSAVERCVIISHLIVAHCDDCLQKRSSEAYTSRRPKNIADGDFLICSII